MSDQSSTPLPVQLERVLARRPTPKHKYNLKRDTLDKRDCLYQIPQRLLAARKLPAKIDLRAEYQNIYDQGTLGSCTANALALAFDFTRVKIGLQPILPSRLFIYYNERAYENTVNEDSGAELRTGVKVCAKMGACAESSWPYDISRFRIAPSSACFEEAQGHRAKTYLRLNNNSLRQLKACLVDGFTFVCGISVYESFESEQVARTGVVPLPNVASEELFGGHAVTCVGYDDSKQWFIMRNSWGPEWGDKGHFYLPYAYLTDSYLAADFWTFRSMTDEEGPSAEKSKCDSAECVCEQSRAK